MLREAEAQAADWRARWEASHAESDERLALLRAMQTRTEEAARADGELRAAQAQTSNAGSRTAARFKFLAAQAWRNVAAGCRKLVKS